VLQAFAGLKPSRKIDCDFLALQGCSNDMKVIRGNDYAIHHLGKQGLLCQFGYVLRGFQATAQAFQVYQMLLGMGAKFTILGTTTLMLLATASLIK
jgi:hypothetical protein